MFIRGIIGIRADGDPVVSPDSERGCRDVRTEGHRATCPSGIRSLRHYRPSRGTEESPSSSVRPLLFQLTVRRLWDQFVERVRGVRTVRNALLRLFKRASGLSLDSSSAGLPSARLATASGSMAPSESSEKGRSASSVMDRPYPESCGPSAAPQHPY